MAVTIDGNNGITSPDFEPSSSTVPTNGLFLPTTNALGFATNSTERVRIDSSGNVGIGTSSPGTKLEVNGAIKVATANWFAFGSDNTFYSDSSYGLVIKAPATSNFIAFRSSNDTERARIDSSGNLLVGTTALPGGNGRISANGTSIFYTSVSDGTTALNVAKSSTTNTTGQWFIAFLINNQATGSGYIGANGASQAAFGAFSDIRLKENITELPNQLANICALKPSEFDYKDGSGHQIGFIAQEMQEVYPDAVGEGEDGMLTITGWSKTEARLVKAIQELATRLEALENK